MSLSVYVTHAEQNPDKLGDTVTRHRQTTSKTEHVSGAGAVEISALTAHISFCYPRLPLRFRSPDFRAYAPFSHPAPLT